MRRGWKIAMGVALTLIVLLGINALLIDAETKPAGVTVPGGRILDLPDGKIQVIDRGPRDAIPIVLIHCFTCAIDWWDGMLPALERQHRVVAVDLLGHGGSEKPTSGYSMEDQARLVAEALDRLGVSGAEVVGHSLGGAVAVALAKGWPARVGRVVIIDTPPTNHESGLGLLAQLAFAPVVGEALWRVKPDFAVRQGLEVAFAPGYDVPDRFVADVDRMTFSAYADSASAFDDYTGEEALGRRMKSTGLPLLVIMGAEEQLIDDPGKALSEYRAEAPGTRTRMIAGAGHSPNVEKPAPTARLVLAFAKSGQRP